MVYVVMTNRNIFLGTFLVQADKQVGHVQK